jgi:hypothetical protein
METNFDKLLNKYISVWLWSILFGAASGLTYSIFSTRPFEKWGMLSTLFTAIYAYLICAIILTWFYLYRFLKGFIIPRFFPTTDEIIDDKILNRKMKLLNMAFLSLLFATVLRVLIPLLESFMFRY